MHALAYIYHWSYTDIVNMDRLERRRWVMQIVEQQEREKAEIDKGTK